MTWRRRPRRDHGDSLLLQSHEEPEAFARFYDLHADRVLRYLRHRSGNAEVAFDLMSETFAKALERRRQFRGNSAAEELNWLFGIARGELMHFWRDGAIERAALERLGIEVPSLVDPEIERIDELASLGDGGVIAALSQLPENQRVAVEIRVLDEASYAELATHLGISVENARARVSRGLRGLARAAEVPRWEST